MQIEDSLPIIAVDNVSYRYGVEPVLDEISFSVRRGEYLGIIGPNGGGKSTLLKVVLGLLQPSSGIVRLFGEDQRNFKSRWRIGYLPQRSAQFELQFPISVEEIVSQGRVARLGLFRNPRSKDWQAIEKAMQITETAALGKRLVGSLSGGELQRVLIARALAAEPDVLLLDEPAVGIDLVSQEKFYAFLRELNQKFGLTVLFVSHDIDVLVCEVSSVLCLNRKLVCHGPPSDVLTERNLRTAYGKNIRFVVHGH